MIEIEATLFLVSVILLLFGFPHLGLTCLMLGVLFV